MLEQDPGLDVASCCVGRSATGDARVERSRRTGKHQRQIEQIRWRKTCPVMPNMNASRSRSPKKVAARQPEPARRRANAINQRLIRELRTIWDDLADEHGRARRAVHRRRPRSSASAATSRRCRNGPGGDVLEEGEVHDPVISRRIVNRLLELGQADRRRRQRRRYRSGRHSLRCSATSR